LEDRLGESELLIEIIQHAPKLKIILTSQERLNIQPACAINVGGLPYREPEGADQAESAGVKLFLGRARHSRAGFLATSYNLPYILRICELVGGLPLGIELAAAALREQRSEEIVALLENDLSVLSTSMQDFPPQHRSMQAALTPAWKRLNAEQQETLRRLASLEGEFELEALAVEAVEVDRLAEQCLLERSNPGSYRLHPLVRLFVKTKPPVSVRAPAQAEVQAERLKTELPTSDVFWDRLGHLLERAERYGQKAAVVLLRLEEYPGATQARELHARLKGRLRRSDTVTRLEEGLFGILLENISSREDSLKVALKLRAALNEPATGQGWIYPPKIQIGISLYPEDGPEAAALVWHAKEALQEG
jgi:GGDEF domain-containing protein